MSEKQDIPVFRLGNKKMTKTAIIYSPKYLGHKTGPNHPEGPFPPQSNPKRTEQEWHT